MEQIEKSDLDWLDSYLKLFNSQNDYIWNQIKNETYWAVLDQVSLKIERQIEIQLKKRLNDRQIEDLVNKMKGE